MAKKQSKQLPTTVDLLSSTRSPIALAAILRTGGGPHSDKRRSKARRNDWRREVEG